MQINTLELKHDRRQRITAMGLVVFRASEEHSQPYQLLDLRVLDEPRLGIAIELMPLAREDIVFDTPPDEWLKDIPLEEDDEIGNTEESIILARELVASSIQCHLTAITDTLQSVVGDGIIKQALKQMLTNLGEAKSTTPP